jgi:DEAD/DEAH box helicase domain-containing protein
MTENQPTDYAAIVRAASEIVPSPPDWLKVGQNIYSNQQGVGEILAVLGKRLIIKFIESTGPTQLPDWPVAVQSGQIQPRNTPLPEANNPPEIIGSSPRISQSQIQAIPDLTFRALAHELSHICTRVEVTNGQAGVLHPLPTSLPSTLISALNRIGIKNLYSHQIEALEILRSGLDLSIVTPTASGKTLCYNLPILESCLNQPHTTALYIFPLKALALDQMRKLGQLFRAMPSNHQLRMGLMTGDTPKDERQRLFLPQPPNILAVSPDLLHHYLYNVRRRDDGEPWRQFLRRLRWVVIDESHTYIGAFGAHFANLMRRLRVAVDRVGGNSHTLQFICSSATIGNPAEMALRFSGRQDQPERLRLIQNSGANTAGRTFLSLAPSNVANPDACKIILTWLQHGLTGIVFCNSRAAVKSLMGIIQRETQRQGLSHLARSVAIFYGSLTGDRRQSIIQQLQQGQVKVILSTSALEAGLDLPELDCCLIRGYPGSLMSFWQRVGRAGRSRHGLVIFLPVTQNALDDFYGRYPEQLLSGQVESASFNPDYPTILSKHIECSCVESGIPIVQVNHQFGNAAGAVIDSLLQQNKLYLSRNNQLWGRGYPHKELNLRSSAADKISLIDQHSREAFEQMSLVLAHREVFPGAIYIAQDPNGDLITYRCESLNPERGEAVLAYLGKDTDVLTEAESQLDIKMLSTLAEPKIIPTSIPGGKLRLTLAWGEITTLVTGYQLLNRKYGLTCKNPQCSKYRQPLEGKSCPNCRRALHSSEIIKVVDNIKFEQPYQTQYQAPCVRVEINQTLSEALEAQMNQIKENIRATYGDDLPDHLKQLWRCATDFVVLHSLFHQVIKAVPMVVLSSSLDVDGVVDDQKRGTAGWLFDTCEGGNGTAEAIFHQLPKFATLASDLAQACNCESGCPRCLTQHGCPQQNTGLHSGAGLFLLDAISSAHLDSILKGD